MKRSFLQFSALLLALAAAALLLAGCKKSPEQPGTAADDRSSQTKKAASSADASLPSDTPDEGTSSAQTPSSGESSKVEPADVTGKWLYTAADGRSYLLRFREDGTCTLGVAKDDLKKLDVLRIGTFSYIEGGVLIVEENQPEERLPVLREGDALKITRNGEILRFTLCSGEEDSWSNYLGVWISAQFTDPGELMRLKILENGRFDARIVSVESDAERPFMHGACTLDAGGAILTVFDGEDRPTSKAGGTYRFDEGVLYIQAYGTEIAFVREPAPGQLIGAWTSDTGTGVMRYFFSEDGSMTIRTADNDGEIIAGTEAHYTLYGAMLQITPVGTDMLMPFTVLFGAEETELIHGEDRRVIMPLVLSEEERDLVGSWGLDNGAARMRFDFRADGTARIDLGAPETGLSVSECLFKVTDDGMLLVCAPGMTSSVAYQVTESRLTLRIQGGSASFDRIEE